MDALIPTAAFPSSSVAKCSVWFTQIATLAIWLGSQRRPANRPAPGLQKAVRKGGGQRDAAVVFAAYEHDGLLHLRPDNKLLRLNRNILPKVGAWFACKTETLLSAYCEW